MAVGRSVVVVGGGITGAATALYLSRSGQRVTVIEKGAIGGAVSGASLACITAHIIDPEEIELLSWCCGEWKNFTRRSKHSIHYSRCGQIRFIEREEDLPAVDRHIKTERLAGFNSSIIDADTLKSLEPNLTGSIVGATYDPDAATVNPFLAVRAYLLQAKALGTEIRSHTAVENIKVQNGCVSGVIANGELISCDSVVLASGPWTAQILRDCGIDLPVLPRKAQCLATVSVPENTIRSVISSCEASSGVEAGYTQIQQSLSGQVLFNTVLAGGLSETGAQDSISEVDPEFVVDSIAQLLYLFPCMKGIQLLRSWVRYEAVAPDQRFLIGPLEIDGLIVAAGDAGTGFIRAPAVAQIVSDFVSEAECQLKYELYAPYRFADWK